MTSLPSVFSYEEYTFRNTKTYAFVQVFFFSFYLAIYHRALSTSVHTDLLYSFFNAFQEYHCVDML